MYNSYVSQAEFNLVNNQDNLVEAIILKNRKLKSLSLRRCYIQDDGGFFSERFKEKFLAQKRDALESLDLSYNPLNVDGIKEYGTLLIV